MPTGMEARFMGGTTKRKKLDMRTKLRSKITLFFMTLGMLLAVPAVAFAADQLLSDVIEASAGPQPVRNLGTVNPGATLTPNVNFSVLCNGAAGHFNSDDSVTLNFNSATSSVSPAAAGATVSATNTTVRGPSAWAADSAPCGTFSTAQAQGSSVATIKAPSTPGTYTYTVNYNLVRSGADPNEIGGAVNPAQFVLTVAQTDSTAPVISKVVTGTLGTNGWYKSNASVDWTVSDPESAISSQNGCADFSVTSDQQATTYTCTATSAGGTSSDSVTIKRDATGPGVVASPDRNADHNGWYNQAITVSFSGNDATSGIANCDPLANYNGPDGTGKSVSGACTDNAGNSASATFGPFNYDDTKPSVTADPDRGPDHNGWYNHAVTFSFSGTDATSSVESCSPDKVYDQPDGTNITVNGTCTDKAGNTSDPGVSTAFDYDATAPTSVSGAPARNPDHNGWYNRPVGITFTGQDAMSEIDSCSTVPYNGPDGTGLTVNGTCTDNAGNESAPVSSSAYKYDSTTPNVTASPDRPADNNGWYNQAVTVSFSGNDATSGLANCDPAVTYGDDNTEARVANKSVSGECTDNAGNSGQGAFTFDYDAHAPTITSLGATTAPNGAGWYKNAIDNTF